MKNLAIKILEPKDKWCIIGGDKFNKDVEDAIVESIKNQMKKRPIIKPKPEFITSTKPKDK